MIKRIIDIAQPSMLSIKNNQLCIQQNKEIVSQTPVEDLGILIFSHYAITLSSYVISKCQENNVVVIFCDKRMLPCSVFLPIFQANNLHHKVLQQQMNASVTKHKQLWKQVVTHKIDQQSKTLKKLNRPTAYLQRVMKNILTGDRTNVEAQAAQYYWKHLFGKPFKRDTALDGYNQLFNYGYAIARSMVARALCGAGLHPTIGIFHRNQNNGLCLADDLIEPFRPWVDYLIVTHLNDCDNATVDKLFKSRILSLPALQIQYKSKRMPLMVALHYLMADFKEGLSRPLKLEYPQWDRDITEWFTED